MGKEKVKHIQQALEENPKRAIYVDRVIDELLFKKLAREIQLLRFESSEPITLYLDSDGGSVQYANQIWDLLKTPKKDGTVCDIVTVVHSSCASAATNLLIHGDYAIAYPQAKIHYHGVLLPLDFAINTEVAVDISHSLRKEDEDDAYKVTSLITSRILGVLRNLKIHSDIIPRYFEFLEDNIADENSSLIEDAKFGIEELDHILHLTSKLTPKKGNQLEQEMLIYKTILSYKIKEVHRFLKQEDNSSMSEYVIGETAELFRSFLNLLNNGYLELIEEKTNSFMQIIRELPPNDARKSKVKTIEFIEEFVRKEFGNIIYFALTFCRLLMKTDHTFSAIEAYYLGLVDEVTGLQQVYREKFL